MTSESRPHVEETIELLTLDTEADTIPACSPNWSKSPFPDKYFD
jgi:hypothetical protein